MYYLCSHIIKARMKIREVIDALEHFAPLPLQDSYDNAGLQVGLTETDVTGALLCLDVTEAIVDEAIDRDCNLIIAHHPLIFHPLHRVSDGTYQERCVVKAILNGITIYAAHTNLDNAVGGVNYKMADRIGLHDLGWLDAHENSVADSGSGVIGTLDVPMTEEAFLDMLRERFHVECVLHNAPVGRRIKYVALCGGAGAFLLDKALALGADAFVTGEMHYHDYFGHEGDLLIAELGHYQSEQFTKQIFRDLLSEQLPDLRLEMTEIDTNPINYLYYGKES